jgi:hypothetical protein
MSALVARRELDLASFERLLRDLPGDYAERLQEAIGASPWAAALLPIRPEQVLSAYRGSAAAETVGRWLADRLTRHRAWVLAAAVEQHLVRRRDPGAIQVDRSLADGVDCFLSQLGPEAGKSLSAARLRLSPTTSKRARRTA